MSYKQICIVASKKRVQALDTEDTALSASTADYEFPTTELTDQECKKGQLTQRPPIPYATSKAETGLKASREIVKMKTPEGEVKMAVLGDNPGPEEYLQHHNAFL